MQDPKQKQPVRPENDPANKKPKPTTQPLNLFEQRNTRPKK